MTRLGRLKRRSEFLRLAGAGRKAASPGLVLQAAPRPEVGTPAQETLPRTGFTCSRKVGNAVARNRARRRLKAAAAEILPLHARLDYDYVIIGRPETLVRPFALLLQDLLGSLKRVGALKQASLDS
ncbi:MAG: ribonuclease P protein component [Alphaproteobacteria bacterium]|nr:ribonuclease P protein component [Alphaproteobacteria bacterium]MBF0355289.1 ribonuclease P protein component [Alphaproteobacteria bacterium]